MLDIAHACLDQGSRDSDSFAANYRSATSRASSDLGVRSFTQVFTAIGSALYDRLACIKSICAAFFSNFFDPSLLRQDWQD